MKDAEDRAVTTECVSSLREHFTFNWNYIFKIETIIKTALLQFKRDNPVRTSMLTVRVTCSFHIQTYYMVQCRISVLNFEPREKKAMKVLLIAKKCKNSTYLFSF